MPIHPVIDTTAAESIQDRISRRFLPFIRQAAQGQVARAGRSQRRWMKHCEVDYEEGDDPKALTYALVAHLIAAAEDHAGDKTLRYTFTLFSAGTDDRQPAVLVSEPAVRIGPDADDDDDDDTPPNAIKASAGLIRDVGDRHIKLLDSTLTVLDRVGPMLAASAAKDAAVAGVEANARIELFKLQSAERQAERDNQESMAMWSTINELSARHKNFLDALANLIAHNIQQATKKAAK